MATHGHTAHDDERSFLPAAGYDWLLPLYDPFVKLLGGDRARRQLLEQADLRAAQRVLDVGCGTGTLVLLIKQLHPAVDVVGIDPDPKARARAQRKAAQAAVAVQIDAGYADALPYPNGSFDRVFSSFMFHHLGSDEKLAMLRQVRRVLRPAGTLHLLDFAASETGGVGLARWFHTHHRMEDNSASQVLTLMREAGFPAAAQTGRGAMWLGLLPYAYYRAPIATASA